MGFFEGKKPAAILKHAVIDKYVSPFAGKTGLYSPGHRVAVIDGYAGEGRYDNGDEASPALLLRKARELQGVNRQLEGYFVESDPTSLMKLRQMVAAEGVDLPMQVFSGGIEDQLDNLLTLVKGIPTLVYLDPFGVMIPFRKTAQVFAQRPSQPPATELLINFSAVGLRRVAGLLTSIKDIPGRPATLARMDAACGGDWWQKVWLDHGDEKERAEEAVVVEYTRRLAADQRCSWCVTPVRNRARHKPLYYLVFLTRHRDGFTEFAEALSLGLGQWRKAVYDIENADTLFADEAAFQASEQALEDGWVNEIEGNLRRLLGEGKSFVISRRYSEVYGKAAGQARQTHLRKAWNRLHPEITKTSPKGKGKLLQLLIEPA
ncbi:three-Cys-motif partner protein TcmP [Micromonospora craniellae]|uniref:three-Cys-motif partner protein TcmP n=1 Tax=Micromonospora craniellae TaxID=2294034 RepID=UPI001314B79D|nr:three-Cys-motif partner protein TcmP [Micromonospora craniellae]QOC90252.1 three-Cys-motif partner protein TcmP [Micromonospora craniellae]